MSHFWRMLIVVSNFPEIEVDMVFDYECYVSFDSEFLDIIYHYTRNHLRPFMLCVIQTSYIVQSKAGCVSMHLVSNEIICGVYMCHSDHNTLL